MSNREFVFYFVEHDTANAEHLEYEIEQLRKDYSPWPRNVKYHVVNDKFDATAKSIIDQLREQKASLAPTFAFVDPFGYSGLPMDLLADLLNYPRTEVFINFMVGHVQRFITRDGQENAMRRLFGIDVADVLAEYDEGRNRVEHLRDVYASQIREQLRYNYVQSFAMINETGNVGYYLLHGTNHETGVKLMKDAMWKIDPGGGFVFSDRLAGQDVLFTSAPDLAPLRTAILQKFRNQQGVPIGIIEGFAIHETPYRETHVRTVLKPLETQKAIAVTRPGRTGYPEGTRINFL